MELKNIGRQVTIKIVKQPTSVAAVKTLVRVLSKDPGHAAENKRLKDIRHRLYAPRRRGGRLYSGRQIKLRRLRGEIGETGTVIATHDVLRDLDSVRRFIELS
ncbi:MAG: hypothetical protein QF785_05845 [Phycisphaeraceae bacterium]|jgi:hypothetical protein|nr:hypothetical protein [Phycisphaeraceae bacterium]